MRGIIVIAALLAACTTQGPAGAEGATGAAGRTAVDGSRLHAITQTASDGAQWTTGGWYDTQLNQDCAFTSTLDGATRCIPGVTGAVGGYYLDAQCQILAAFFSINACGAAGASTYVIQTETGLCTTIAEAIYPVVSMAEPNAPIWQINPQTSACTIVPTTTTQQYVWYSIGQSMALTDFVSIVSTAPTGG